LGGDVFVGALKFHGFLSLKGGGLKRLVYKFEGRNSGLCFSKGYKCAIFIQVSELSRL
jgi:hypothetical protein